MNLTAKIHRDETGAWIAHVTEEPRVHTFGRTVPKALLHLREAAALWFDTDEDDIEFTLQVELKPNQSAPTLIRRALKARRTAEEAQAAANEATLAAVHALIDDAGLSVRDTAALLGISHQRIHQLVGK
jgi:predicted RNase H-like HicB family nuclease